MDASHSSRRFLIAAVLLVAAITMLFAMLTTAGQTAAPESADQEATPESITVHTDHGCGWQPIVFVWLDIDRDGIRDSDESPLKGVEVGIGNIRNGLLVSKESTAFDGFAYPYVDLPCGLEVQFVIAATLPEGYEATTPLEIHPEGTGYFNRGPYAFGLRPLSDAVGAASRARYECSTRYTIPEVPLDLQTAPDGTVWAAGYQDLYYFDSADDTWVEVDANRRSDHRLRFSADGSVWLGPSGAREGMPSIGQAPDGTIWFIGYSQRLLGTYIVSYHPEKDVWHMYYGSEYGWNFGVEVIDASPFWLIRRGKGIIGDSVDEAGHPIIYHEFAIEESHYIDWVLNIQEIAIAPDGMIWVADDLGISRLDPMTHEWTRYSPFEGDFGPSIFPSVYDVDAAPDGSVWLVSGHNFGRAVQIVPLSDTLDEGEWYVYYPGEGMPAKEDITRIAAGADGSIWLGGFGEYMDYTNELARCQPVTP